MIIESNILFADLNINRNDILWEIGYSDILPDNEILEMISELLEMLSSIAMPKYAFRIIEGHEEGNELVLANSHLQIGKIISKQLKGSERYVLFLATAGMELERFMEEIKRSGDMLKLFLVDTIGSLMAERAADVMERSLTSVTADQGLRLTNRYSPGYCEWHVSEQRQLFGLMPAGICGISLTESCLMVPIKSVSGLIGLGAQVTRKDYTCAICDFKDCYKRNRRIPQ